LGHKRIAIAGLGGVGGAHLLTLTRLGVGGFHIADYDSFELANFNRQAGANVATIGRRKTEVLLEMAKAINPELDVVVFDEGVNDANCSAFLRGIDQFVDGLDFFAFNARHTVFAACARLGIPATTVAPLGMGAALLNFLPGQMTFEDYFGWEGRSDNERALRFLVGLSPAMLQRSYVADPAAIDFGKQRGPSTPMACELCAGIAATESLKILLGRGRILAAPRGLHFDAYRGRLVRTWRPWGNRHPLQRLAIAIARRHLRHFSERHATVGTQQRSSSHDS
jgi:molybdopterin/thiamine biosynthesis adenylyltransferase